VLDVLEARGDVLVEKEKPKKFNPAVLKLKEVVNSGAM